MNVGSSSSQVKSEGKPEDKPENKPENKFKPENDSRLKGLSVESKIELLEASIIPALLQDLQSHKNLKAQALQAIIMGVVYFSVVLAGFAIFASFNSWLSSFNSWLSYGLLGLAVLVFLYFVYRLFNVVLNPREQKDLENRILVYEEYLRKMLIRRDDMRVQRAKPGSPERKAGLRKKRI